MGSSTAPAAATAATLTKTDEGAKGQRTLTTASVDRLEDQLIQTTTAKRKENEKSKKSKLTSILTQTTKRKAND